MRTAVYSLEQLLSYVRPVGRAEATLINSAALVTVNDLR